MAGQFSKWMGSRMLNKALRGEDFTVTTSLWIALFRTTDSAALRANIVASASEVAAVGYSRIEVRGATPLTFQQASEATTQVSGLLMWPAAGTAWGTLTFAAVMDAPTEGNVVVFGALASPKVVDAGDTFKIPVGLFTIAL